MSNPALKWAFQQKVRPASSKLILLSLANFANEKTSFSFPCIKTLCEITSLNRKTIIAGLTRLEKDGFITDTKQRKGTTKQVVVYEVNSPKNGTVPKTDEKNPVFSMKESRFFLKQSQKRDTELLRTGKEPKGNGAPRYDSEIERHIERHKEERKRLHRAHFLSNSLNGGQWDKPEHAQHYDELGAEIDVLYAVLRSRAKEIAANHKHDLSQVQT